MMIRRCNMFFFKAITVREEYNMIIYNKQVDNTFIQIFLSKIETIIKFVARGLSLKYCARSGTILTRMIIQQCSVTDNRALKGMEISWYERLRFPAMFDKENTRARGENVKASGRKKEKCDIPSVLRRTTFSLSSRLVCHADRSRAIDVCRRRARFPFPR